MSTRNRRSSEAKRAKRRRNRRLAVGLFCVALVGMVYLGGYAYFKGHFMPGTTINGVDCGLGSPKKAYDEISSHITDYALKINSKEGELELKAADVGLRYDNSEDLNTILKMQDTQKWFMNLNKKQAYQVMKVNVDDEAFTKATNALACMNPATPVVSENAKIVFDEDSGSFQIKAGAMGNLLNTEKFTQDVRQAVLDSAEAIDVTGDEYYQPAQYTADSQKVKDAKEQADGYLKAKISYEDGEKKLNISKKSLSSFVKISSDYKVHVSSTAVGKYVKKKLAKKFDTTKSMNIVNSPGSGKIYIAQGSEGNRAVDVEKEKEELLSSIRKGKDLSRKPHYITQFLYSSYGEDIKKDYVDINLSKQTVYVVINNKIAAETPCVTGNTSAGRGTPTGVYHIAYKTTNHTMVKYNAFVYYWMPYDTTYGIGLHDATWRSASEFGGNTYKYNGSHACINLPLEAARKIYNIVYAGIPVIVHW